MQIHRQDQNKKHLVPHPQQLDHRHWCRNFIKWHTNAKVDKVEADKVTISECDDNGEAVKTVEIASKHTMLLPAFKGVDAVANLADVATGFVNPRIKNFSKAIFAKCIILPFFAQVTLRGGICGIATKAAPVSPISAIQTAFQVGILEGAFLLIMSSILCTTAATIDSII
jgi:hypothetical protein